MVVARKSRPQTAHRIFDFSGAEVVKPESEGLAAWIGIKVQTPARMLVGPEPGRLPAPADLCWCVEVEDSLSWAVGVKEIVLERGDEGAMKRVYGRGMLMVIFLNFF